MSESNEGYAASDSPRVHPENYPGRWPDRSVVITPDDLWELRDRNGDALNWEQTPPLRISSCRVRREEENGRARPSLNRVAESGHFVPMDARVPVISIGSNAAPSQLRFKFSEAPEKLFIPSLRARARGLAIGYTTFTASFGYVPATVFPREDSTVTLAVQFLDPRQLKIIDDSESGHYRRVWLGVENGIELVLETGERMQGAYAYVANWGVLTDAAGVPMDLSTVPGDGGVSQLELWEMLQDDGVFTMPRTNLTAEQVQDFARAVREAGRAEYKNPFEQLEDHIGKGALKYGSLLPLGATDERLPGLEGMQTAWVQGTPEGLERRGKSIIRLSAEDRQALGNPEIVEIRSAALQSEHGLAAPSAIAAVLPSVPGGPKDPDPGVAHVDHVLRMACGLERGDAITLKPGSVNRTRWADGLLGAPTYLTMRVTLAEPTSAERDTVLMNRLALDVLGVSNGDYIVVEGALDDKGVTRTLVVKVFEVSGEAEDYRRGITGGVWGARFPSAADTLGIQPDLPMIFMDAELRSQLAIMGQTLASVRVRPARLHQFYRELREMLLVLAVAFLGIVVAVPSEWLQGALIFVLIAGTLGLIVARMRSRLSHRTQKL